MKIQWEENLPYGLLALLVLAVFYGIYFAKMLAQKRHGIRTHQIGRRKEKDLHTVETLMSVATFGIVRPSFFPSPLAGTICPQAPVSPASAWACWAI